MSVQAHVGEDEKFPFYSVRFREELEEWEDDDEFEPNAELSDEEAADFRRVKAEHEEWQRKLSEMHQAWWAEQMRRRQERRT